MTEKWTKRCTDGRGCDAGFGRGPNFIPDDVDVCDTCILNRYGLHGNSFYYDGWDEAFHRDTVIKALRKAENERREA
jgi:hypothetical protein